MNAEVELRKVSKLTKILETVGIELALLALIIISGVMEPKFIRSSNVINVLRQVSVTGVIAVGMTLVIINNGIDLSVCGIVGLSGMVAIILQPQGTLFAVACALAVGAVSGVINGFCISQGLAPFIMTMAMDTVLRGLAYLTSNGQPVAGVTDAYKFLGAGYMGSFMLDGKVIGLPTPVVIFILVSLLAHVMLSRTPFGRHIYSVGGNAEAARLSGISIKKTKMIVFAISGFLAALSSIMLTARMAACDPTLGTGYNVDAIAAAVIGGTSMSGGEGKIYKTVIGAMIITIMSNILNMVNVNPYVQQVVKGLIIFVTVYADNWKKTH
ncbi:ribose ABC transporter permease [Synergistales bacterium]|nr:ribose ABC transporter permease [Synergistales bacterium]